MYGLFKCNGGIVLFVINGWILKLRIGLRYVWINWVSWINCCFLGSNLENVL